MNIRDWMRPPRQLLVLFLGTTVVLGAGLAWLGVRALQQDRSVESQRVRAGLEDAVDLIAAGLRDHLAETDAELTRLLSLPAAELDASMSEYATSLGADAVLVHFDPDSVSAHPRSRLLYYPTLLAVEEPTEPFARGEAREFRRNDFAGAISYFDSLLGTDDELVRAGALLRLARNQRKAGREEEALDTYEQLAAMGQVPAGGLPAELVARGARCDLLQELDREVELRAEAANLERDLDRGRWQLTRASYLHWAQRSGGWRADAQGQGQDLPRASPASASLAAGVSSAWTEWQRTRAANASSGGDSSPLASQVTMLWLDDHPVFLVWKAGSDRLVGLVAGPVHIESVVLGSVEPLLRRQEVVVALTDSRGHLVAGLTPPAGSTAALRTTADSGLPWTLRVASSDPTAVETRLAGRRRVLLTAFGLVGMLVLAGTYFSARAVAQEIETARLQSSFVAAVSHEFRTPLTSMRQFSDLLLEGRVRSEEDRLHSYGALQRSTRRLTRLVEDLLDFGRMEAGSHEFALRPLQAREWVFSVVSEFGAEARERGYEVEVDWNGSDPLIAADDGALGRALWNLLDNAVKYSPDCRTVWVEGRVHGSSLEVSVRDRGLGIPPPEQRSVFGKFVRGTAATDTAKGTGLGLALAREIVRAHGGELALASQPGEGSTFTIRLPLQE